MNKKIIIGLTVAGAGVAGLLYYLSKQEKPTDTTDDRAWITALLQKSAAQSVAPPAAAELTTWQKIINGMTSQEAYAAYQAIYGKAGGYQGDTPDQTVSAILSVINAYKK